MTPEDDPPAGPQGGVRARGIGPSLLCGSQWISLVGWFPAFKGRVKHLTACAQSSIPALFSLWNSIPPLAQLFPSAGSLL